MPRSPLLEIYNNNSLYRKGSMHCMSTAAVLLNSAKILSVFQMRIGKRFYSMYSQCKPLEFWIKSTGRHPQTAIMVYQGPEWPSCFQQWENQRAGNTFRHWTTGSAELWSLTEGKQMRRVQWFLIYCPEQSGLGARGGNSEPSSLSELWRLRPQFSRVRVAQSCRAEPKSVELHKRTLEICRNLGWELICQCVTGGTQGRGENHWKAESKRPPSDQSSYRTGNSSCSLKPE